ncbi:MAG: YdcF family protein [Bryobacterales bacterium]|nr:YdcF family protein [Bryobacterales bacterium]
MTYLEPVTPALLLLMAVFLAVKRLRLVWLTLAATALIHWQPAAYLFELPLTHGYSENPPRSANPGAIVVLSGYVAFPEDTRDDPEFGQDTQRRVSRAVRLHRHWRPLRIYTTGGRLGGSPISYAAAMKGELVRRGVPPDSVRIEERSATTYENAVNTAAQLKADGVDSVVLVTSKYHLLRAELCFRKQGIAVYPVSADAKADWGVESVVPGWSPERTVGRTVHEYVALVWYRLRGRL